MSQAERFLFETTGMLIIPDALSSDEVSLCLAASERLHSNLQFINKQNRMQAGETGTVDSVEAWQSGGLQQLDNAWEAEPVFEPLIDHPSCIEKVRSLVRSVPT